MAAGILLILAGMHTGVIGNADNKTCVNAGVAHGEERVAGNVETNVLHAAKCSLAGKSCAEGNFHCNLFVGSPFAVNFLIFCSLFAYLGAGSSGIAGKNAAG